VSNEKVSLEFDGGDAKKGYQDIAKSAREAGQANVEMARDVGTVADACSDAGDEAKGTASKVSTLGNEIAGTSGQAQKAEGAIESFTISVDKAGQKMDVAADKAEHLARAQARVASGGHGAAKGVDALKDGAGGLDAILSSVGLGGAAQFAGTIERLTLGAKDLSAATGGMGNAITKIAIPLAAAYAIYKSMETIFNSTLELMPEIRVQWDALTESVSGYLEEGRKVLNDWGFLNDEAEELKKKNAELKKSFDDNNKALTEAQAKINPVTDAIKSLNDEIERGRQQEKIEVEVQGIETVESAEREIQNIQKSLDEISKRPSLTIEAANMNAAELEAAWKMNEPRLRALEERRKQLQQQEKQAADERKKVADAEKKTDEDATKRHDDEHDAEMDRIKTETDAKKKAANELAKSEADAAKKSRDARIEEILKSKESTDTKIEGIQQVQQAEQQSQEQPNKYGEGIAPTAGKKNSDAYAGAIDPLSQFTTDYDMGGNSFMMPGGSGPGSDKSAQKKVIQEAVAEQLRQHEADYAKGLASKYDVEGDVNTVQGVVDAVHATGRKVDFKDDLNQFNREQRGLKKTETQSYRKSLAGKDTGEDADVQADRQNELLDASQNLLDESKQAKGERNQMAKDHLDITKELAQTVRDDRSEIASMKGDVDAIKRVMAQIAQANQQRGRMGRGGMPSNATSQLRANP